MSGGETVNRINPASPDHTKDDEQQDGTHDGDDDATEVEFSGRDELGTSICDKSEKHPCEDSNGTYCIVPLSHDDKRALAGHLQLMILTLLESNATSVRLLRMGCLEARGGVFEESQRDAPQAGEIPSGRQPRWRRDSRRHAVTQRAEAGNRWQDPKKAGLIVLS